MEALTQEQTIQRQYNIIPESPSHKKNVDQNFIQQFSLISPRTVLTPRNFSSQTTEQQESKFNQVSSIQKESNQIQFPSDKLNDQAEIKIIDELCKKYTYLSFQTSCKNLCFQEQQYLSNKYNRALFDKNDEIRVLSDIFFENILGLPCFLSWNFAYIYNEYIKLKQTSNQESLIQQMNIISEQCVKNDLSYRRIYSDVQQPLSHLTMQNLKQLYYQLFYNKSEQERLFNAIKLPTHQYIQKDDLQRLVISLLNLHPGLQFLKNTLKFQLLYSETVALRIITELDSNFKGYLTLRDIQRSTLLESLRQTQLNTDINKQEDIFSYEQFYVIYVSWYQLDIQKQKQITLGELYRYNNNGVSKLAIKRIYDLLLQIRLKSPQLYFQYYLDYIKKSVEYNKNDVIDWLSKQTKLFYTDFIRFIIYLENNDLKPSFEFMSEVINPYDSDNITEKDLQDIFISLNDRIQSLGYDQVLDSDVFDQMVQSYQSNSNQITKQVQQLCQNQESRGISLKLVSLSQRPSNIFSVLLHLQRFQEFDIKDPYSIQDGENQFQRFCRNMYEQQVSNADD